MVKEPGTELKSPEFDSQALRWVFGRQKQRSIVVYGECMHVKRRFTNYHTELYQRPPIVFIYQPLLFLLLI